MFNTLAKGRLTSQIIPVEQASFLPIRNWSHVINSVVLASLETTRLSVPKSIQLNEKVELTIFVVDDNAVNRKVLDSMLQKIGCPVHTARQRRRYESTGVWTGTGRGVAGHRMPVAGWIAATQAIREQELQSRQTPADHCCYRKRTRSDKQQYGC